MPAEQQIQYADPALQQQPDSQTKLCYSCQSTLQDPAQSLYCSLCRPHAVAVPLEHPPPPPAHLQQQQQQQQSSPARRPHGHDNGLSQQNNAAVQQAVGSDSHLQHTYHIPPPAAPSHAHAHAPSTPYSNNNNNNNSLNTTSCRKPALVSLQCSNIASSTSSSSSPTSTSSSASASALYRHQQPHQHQQHIPTANPFEGVNATSSATSTLSRSGTPGTATAQQPQPHYQHQQHHIGSSCPDPLTDVTRLRIRTRAHHCLYPGATFQGTQKSGRNSYDVNVTIVDVNFPASTLCGYLRIRGLTDDWPELTTYFDAEIIGSRYGFLTQNWGATQHEDIVHWSRFPAFKHIRQEAMRPHMTLDERDRGVVFMRWKERFLVPDHRVQDINGASFAGFYYVCVDFNPPATPPSPSSDTHAASAATMAMDTDTESEPNMPSTPESFGQNVDLDMDDEDAYMTTSSSPASHSFYSYHQRQRQQPGHAQHLLSPSPSSSPSPRRKSAGRSRTRRGGFSMGDEGIDGFVDEDEDEDEHGDDGEGGVGVFGFGVSHDGNGRKGRGRGRKRRGASLAPPGSLAVATMSGFYYHQNSEPYQQLSLAHVPEQTSSSFEFR